MQSPMSLELDEKNRVKECEMKILAISDVVLSHIYQPRISERFSDVDLIISCGDLPHYYLEYIISTLNVPLYYVNGNHANKIEITSAGERHYPWGAINVHKKTHIDDSGVLISGIEGSLRYNRGPHQYTQSEMWQMVLRRIPSLLLNKMRFGRYLDFFITHAPPFKIHDRDDRPHTGIKAFNWFDRVFQPTYHLHGHIHLYRNDDIRLTKINQTSLVNCYGYQVLNFDMKPVIEGIKRRGSFFNA